MERLVIGHGEIGQAVAKVFEITDWVDLYENNFNKSKYDVLHVCIPFSNKYTEVVNEYIKTFEPQITIIHSTVEIGTTRKINGLKVNSPIRGRHKELHIGLRQYCLCYGYEKKEEMILADKCFKRHIREVTSVNGYETTEAAKLLSLLQYAVNIEFARYANSVCKSNDIDYDVAVKGYTHSYNSGVRNIDNPGLVKTILDPPKGKIGGHCVLPACNILSKSNPSNLVNAILEINEEEE